ncbi:hypothetical protein OIN60_06670 [Paenibacillus sp. P96]|uniref:DUF805 domain-containing protein n=1 Tax=Paenibacillus zeirhizosphaerae TaxID=2987519 RepID=A0ABT9FNZ7_9BACL|nr:hypothetical protein [Paenibacillus sp. P96]MDP4096450.1 hypothetical protein [Paenibacillus sp. P96]
MSISRILKWISGILELGLAIPIIGGSIIIFSGYSALGFMFVLHAITVILSVRNQEPAYGSLFGILTSLLAWIPVVGWLMHLIAGILCIMTGIKNSPRYNYPPNPF